MIDRKDVTIDVLTRASRRSIGLHITDDGKLEVRAPRFVPLFIIERFVAAKRDWIVKTKDAMRKRPRAINVLYQEGSVFRIAGNRYTLRITEGNAIVTVGSRLFFPKKFLPRAKHHMEQWLRVFAKKYLTQRLDDYAEKMDVSYKKVSIRDTSSRWGSCSSSGTISFSYRLILADRSIIDYVVIHELAHVTHHHHAKVFWDRVGKFYPDYKQARTWLRKNGHTLKI